MTETQVLLEVARDFENRRKGLPDDSPLAVEAHRRRAVALHQILDDAPGGVVVDWEKTDDAQAHEVVFPLIDFAPWLLQPPHIEALSATALAVGKLLGTTALSEGVKAGVAWIFDRLRGKQREEVIENVIIKPTPQVSVQMDPPRYGGRVYVSVLVEGVPFGVEPVTTAEQERVRRA